MTDVKTGTASGNKEDESLASSPTQSKRSREEDADVDAPAASATVDPVVVKQGAEPLEVGELSQEAGAKRPRMSLDANTKKRSQRLFGVLVGTLTQFKKDTGLKSEKLLQREQKELEIANRLRKERDELAAKVSRENEERKAANAERREREDRHREETTKMHLRNQESNMANYLKTKTNPPICFLPAKHTQLTTELLTEAKRALVLASVTEDEKPDEVMADAKESSKDDDKESRRTEEEGSAAGGGGDEDVEMHVDKE
ncbi:pinin/SDK/memA/ protein conserved region-domain-containing protein [Blyttiomyces helicus]|uniref:Pinin/SDK/memA/ protein conserved region-domain-containing protein n=1 Tax=Blyttiomyces helicus TaxID=388810 RepID=A0A4P9WME0_9FUNG|nr:pinin/SDK/memA/ protein conserved region-domain-containing protein [Blyttiomyces helicus]|eukprot:RKO91886.1 pinin/SDK/memA/ protein conserved region-domain-containing protein [Blyttiomyces helicus]